jgi:hypothetical membrane protein
MRLARFTDLCGALGGVIGPTCFVAGWTITARATPHFSSTREAISQLARIGAPHRWTMSVAFFLFGVGLLALAPVLSRALQSGSLRVAVSVSALGALGVAAFPLARHSGGLEDHTHVFWAVFGYVGTIATPLLASSRLFQTRHKLLSAASLVAGLVSFGSLVGSGFSSVPGFWQRTGLGVVDVWFVVAGIWLLQKHWADAPVAGAESPRHR